MIKIMDGCSVWAVEVDIINHEHLLFVCESIIQLYYFYDWGLAVIGGSGEKRKRVKEIEKSRVVSAWSIEFFLKAW
jgi:hypothetical protein